MRAVRLLLCALALAFPAGAARAQAPAGDVARQAEAVLKKHCFECHGQNPRKLKGDLDLFDRSHLDDPGRKILVKGRADDSELFKRVQDDTMPPGARAKLSAAEKQALRDWVAAGGPAFPGDGATATAANAPAPSDQAARVKEVFRVHCLECHGGTKKQAGVSIHDHAVLLAKAKVVPGQPDNSPLYQLLTADDESVMPPAGQPRLSQDEIDAVRQWIAAGAAPFPPDVTPPAEPNRDAALAEVAGVDYVHKKILAHVRATRTEDRQYLRYFSLNHLLTAGATAAELEVHREALAKAVNHLSWEPTLVRPRAVDDPVNTVFCVDLRQLGWQRRPFQAADTTPAAGMSAPNLFDLALLEYPYAVVYEDSETYDRLREEFLAPAGQARPVPYVRADWFVSVVTQPPLYDDVMQLPFTIGELEAKLGVDSAANLRDNLAPRAGMAVSGVSRNNRVVERHRSPNGSYWKSYDFRTSRGAENMFRDPLAFREAGGEMIFTLPNQLQGYFVCDNQGIRVDAAPTDIVTDKFAEDRTVRNGLSCIRCHDRGMKDFADVVRPALLRLPGSPGFDKRKALDLYPEQAVMDALVKEDTDRFQGAMQRLLGRVPAREPLVPVSRRFLDDPLHLGTAAGELGLNDPTGLQGLFRTPLFSGLGLVPLAAQGVVRRDAWEDYYDQVVRGLGLGVPVVPLDGGIRREYPSGTPPFAVTLATNKTGNVFEPGEQLVISVTNKSDRTVFLELVGTSTRGRKVILAPSSTTVAPGATFRFPETGGINIRGGLGKEQITLLASQSPFPAGVLWRGQGVTDRVVHPFYQFTRDGTGRARVTFDAAGFVRQTIDIETR